MKLPLLRVNSSSATAIKNENAKFPNPNVFLQNNYTASWALKHQQNHCTLISFKLQTTCIFSLTTQITFLKLESTTWKLLTNHHLTRESARFPLILYWWISFTKGAFLAGSLMNVLSLYAAEVNTLYINYMKLKEPTCCRISYMNVMLNCKSIQHTYTSTSNSLSSCAADFKNHYKHHAKTKVIPWNTLYTIIFNENITSSNHNCIMQ